MALAVGLGSAVAVSCGYDGGLLWLEAAMASGFFFFFSVLWQFFVVVFFLNFLMNCLYYFMKC